jgi:hypothetical protein
MPRVDAQMEAQMQTCLAGMPTHEPLMTPRLKVGHPRQVIVAPAEALGVDLLVMGAQRTCRKTVPAD